MNIGKSIKHALVDKDIKAKDLAVELGVTPAYVSALSNGNKSAGARLLLKLSIVFGMPVSEFIALGEEKAA